MKLIAVDWMMGDWMAISSSRNQILVPHGIVGDKAAARHEIYTFLFGWVWEELTDEFIIYNHIVVIQRPTY